MVQGVVSNHKHVEITGDYYKRFIHVNRPFLVLSQGRQIATVGHRFLTWHMISVTNTKEQLTLFGQGTCIGPSRARQQADAWGSTPVACHQLHVPCCDTVPELFSS